MDRGGEHVLWGESEGFFRGIGLMKAAAFSKEGRRVSVDRAGSFRYIMDDRDFCLWRSL